MKTDQKKLTTEYHDFGMQRIVYDSLFEQNAKKRLNKSALLGIISSMEMLKSIYIGGKYEKDNNKIFVCAAVFRYGIVRDDLPIRRDRFCRERRTAHYIRA
jgi:hypothetical protein